MRFRPAHALVLALGLTGCGGASVATPTETTTATATPDSSASPTALALSGQVAYVAGNDPQIHLLDLVTGESRQLTTLRPEDGTPAAAAGPLRPALSCAFGPHGLAWSPDGSLLAFQYGGCEAVIWVVDVEGEARRIADGAGPAWSADGTRLLFSANRPWAPCGAACLGEEPAPGAWSLQVVDVAGSDPPRPFGSGATFGGYGPTWSPDGEAVAFAGPMPADGGAVETVTATYVVDAAGENPRLVARGGWPFGWLPDGRLLIVDERTGAMRAVDLGSTEAEPIGAGGASVQAVSSDGDRLLQNVSDPATGGERGRIIDLAGTEIAALDGRAEAWSPGGEWLVATEADGSTITVHDRDGALLAKHELPGGASIGQLHWRPEP